MSVPISSFKRTLIRRGRPQRATNFDSRIWLGACPPKGTEGSNPSPSSGESPANLNTSIRVDPGRPISARKSGSSRSRPGTSCRRGWCSATPAIIRTSPSRTPPSQAQETPIGGNGVGDDLVQAEPSETVIDDSLCRFKGIALAPIGTCEPPAHLDRGCERRPIRLVSPGISTAHWHKRCLSKCACIRAIHALLAARSGKGSSISITAGSAHIAANGSRSVSCHSRNSRPGVRSEMPNASSARRLDQSRVGPHGRPSCRPSAGRVGNR